MSLENYCQLQADSRTNDQLLGVTLPELVAGCLSVNSHTCSTEQTISTIASFEADQGWLMYRDDIVLCTSAPERCDFIEGEWCRGEHSLKIKLIGPEQYLVTEVTSSEKTHKPQAYSEQWVYLRNELKEQANHNAACYRFWWQQEQSGEHQGRWVPFIQQFIGFGQDKEVQ